MNNNSYSSGNQNSFKEAINTFSNIPISSMTNSRSRTNEPSYNEPTYNEPSYNEPKTNNMKGIFIGIFIIVLLSLLGYNVFNYLAQGTDIVTAIISPVAYVVTMLTGDTAKTTLQHTSQGTQVIATESSNFLQMLLKLITDLFNNSVKFIANTTTSGIDYLQSTIKQDKISSTAAKETEKEEDEDEDEDNALKNERKIEKRIEDIPNNIKNLIVKKEDKLPQPTRSDSQHHGFCYIGKENNLRHCAKVSSKSKCMSGDIFPTMDLCINPKLR
jgi:hypothetical protein